MRPKNFTVEMGGKKGRPRHHSKTATNRSTSPENHMLANTSRTLPRQYSIATRRIPPPTNGVFKAFSLAMDGYLLETRLIRISSSVCKRDCSKRVQTKPSKSNTCREFATRRSPPVLDVSIILIAIPFSRRSWMLPDCHLATRNASTCTTYGSGIHTLPVA